MLVKQTGIERDEQADITRQLPGVLVKQTVIERDEQADVPSQMPRVLIKQTDRERWTSRHNKPTA